MQENSTTLDHILASSLPFIFNTNHLSIMRHLLLKC